MRFRRIKKDFTPYNVTDKVTFRNVDRALPLTVREDSKQIVHKLKQVPGVFAKSANSSETERLEGARFFAAALFGEEQAQKVVDLFDGDAAAIITVCSDYFNNRLVKIITKVQKKEGSREIKKWKRGK